MSLNLATYIALRFETCNPDIWPDLFAFWFPQGACKSQQCLSPRDSDLTGPGWVMYIEMPWLQHAIFTQHSLQRWDQVSGLVCGCWLVSEYLWSVGADPFLLVTVQLAQVGHWQVSLGADYDQAETWSKDKEDIFLLDASSNREIKIHEQVT